MNQESRRVVPLGRQLRRQERFRLDGLIVCALVTTCLLANGCGGSDGGGLGGAVFVPSTTPAGSGLVRLEGEALSNDIVRVDVVVDGPTTDLDYYSFAFDLLLSDPTVVQFVPGSAVFGDALELGAGQGFAVEVSQQGDRVIVGVTKTGGGVGNQIGPGERLIVSFEFDVSGSGMTGVTYAGSPANPQNPTNEPAALDNLGGAVDFVSFDTESAVISR